MEGGSSVARGAWLASVGRVRIGHTFVVGLVGTFAEGVSHNAVCVEVWEDLRAEGVDDLGDFGREGLATSAELDEGAGGARIEGNEEGRQGFQDVHADLADAEGGEGDGDHEDEEGDGEEPHGDEVGDVGPCHHPPGDAVGVVAVVAVVGKPCAHDDGVVEVECRGEGHCHEQLPGRNDVAAL